MIARPDFRFLIAHPAHFIAFGFGTGLAPVAPGTVGTLLGFPVYFALAWFLSPLEVAAAGVLMFALGVWACGRTGTALGISDHSGMVWDEVAAFVLILVMTPPGPWWWALAFFVFRFFDVLKPPPIREIDRRMKGGFGVMFDDIAAGFYTLLVIAVIARIVGN